MDGFPWNEDNDQFVCLEDTGILSGPSLLSVFQAQEQCERPTMQACDGPKRKPRRLEMRALRDEAAQLVALLEILSRRKSGPQSTATETASSPVDSRRWRVMAEQELKRREQAVEENLRLRKQLRGNSQLVSRIQKQLRLVMAHTRRELSREETVEQPTTPESPSEQDNTSEASESPMEMAASPVETSSEYPVSLDYGLVPQAVWV